MDETVYRILGQRTREARHRLGWSQEELGERTGLHFTYIGKIERGEKKISLAALHKLAGALGVKMGDLLCEEPLEYKPSTLEKKITHVVRDRPAQEQEVFYQAVKSLDKVMRRSRGPAPLKRQKRAGRRRKR